MNHRRAVGLESSDSTNPILLLMMVFTCGSTFLSLCFQSLYSPLRLRGGVGKAQVMVFISQMRKQVQL